MGSLTRSTRPLFLVTFSTMLSMLALLEVACSLAAFGGSMCPWYTQWDREMDLRVGQAHHDAKPIVT